MSKWYRVSALALLCLVVVALVWHNASQGAVPKQDPHKPLTYSPNKPDESKPKVSAYQTAVSGSQPYLIDLPTIHAKGPIQKVGVDQNNQIATPGNVHVAGWFVQSVAPGDLGLSIIDGHVDGYTQPGIFEQLGHLKVGDTFTITAGSGQLKHFVVKTVKTVNVDLATDALYSQLPGVSHQLNLVTCGGTYDRTGKHYLSRVIVSAEYAPGSKHS